MKIGYVATYTEKTSEGIYQFQLDENSGMLSHVSLLGKVKNSKYLALTKEYLFSLHDEEEGSGVTVLDLDGNSIDKLTFGKGAACYILAVGDSIYTTNYSDGTVCKLHFDPKTKKLSLVTSYSVQEKAGCHQAILMDGKYLVPCLLLDKILVFDENLKKLDEIPFPQGSGPRHGVVSKDAAYLYIIGELSNKVYAVNTKTKEIEAEISILPQGEEQNHGGAALRLSEDGKRLYASTREEQNRITTLDISGKDMTVESTFSSQGRHPRDILNVLNDRYLLVANRGTNTLHSFDIHNKYKEINNVEVPEGVSILLGGQ